MRGLLVSYGVEVGDDFDGGIVTCRAGDRTANFTEVGIRHCLEVHTLTRAYGNETKQQEIHGMLSRISVGNETLPGPI